MMNESILDIPRKTLDPEVFDVDKGDVLLSPTVRAEILRQSEMYNQWGEVKRVLLIGSILTRHWKSDSDIDVTLLFKPMSSEAFEAAKQHSAQSQDTMPLLATAHPLNFYIRNDLIRDGWDNIYDVTGNGWVKRSPESVAKSAEEYLRQFDRLIKDIDLEKGELYRDLIDYAELIELGEADVDDLHTRVAEKAEEIDDQVKKLVMIHKALHRMRKSAFERPLTADEVREYKTKNLLPVSVLYKLLERYHYLKLLKELEKVLKAADGDITTAKDVKGVEKAVKADGVVEELITELTTAVAAGPYEVPLGATPVGRQQWRKRKKKDQNMKKTLLTLASICFAVVGYAGTYIDGVPDISGGGATNITGWSSYPATADILPASSGTVDIGSPSLPFRSGYFREVFASITTRSSVSTSMVFTALSATNTFLPLPYPDCNVSWGKLYITDTNTFSKTLTLTLYANNDYKGSNAYWRANMPLVTVPLAAEALAGWNRMQTVDASEFRTNDLVYTCDSNEFARIQAITNNDLYFDDVLSNPHGITASVSRVCEFGGFSTIDYSGKSNIWHRLAATNNFTQTLRLDAMIRR
jgi:hypothetical protein